MENFSPAKVKVESGPSTIIDRVIPNVSTDYHDPESRTIPILARPVQALTATQLFQLMIGAIPQNRVCHRKPTGVTYGSVFVVDLSYVDRIKDLRADDNGAWVHGGKPQRKYVVELDEKCEVTSAVSVKAGAMHGDNIFTLVRIYHRNKATREFQRRISYVFDSSNQMVRFAVIQYLFDDGEEVPIILPLHGNSKKAATPYQRIQTSTLEKMKETRGTPKSVVSLLHGEAGGSVGASSASELPRNRRQVLNAHQTICDRNKTSGKSDQVFDLIKQCKEDGLPHGRKFVRSVSIDSSLSSVLALDTQLKNLVRFCTKPGAFCVFGIDPTFNLGKFYVTLTTYTYLQLKNKNTGVCPTFWGPMFVHTERTYEAYYYFFPTLLKLEPKLASVCAFGTDGEQALTKAILAVFPDEVINLRCYLHMKDNIRRKLTDLLIPESHREVILRDIFGSQQGTMYIKGLLDSSDANDFDYKLSLLRTRWDDMELATPPHRDPSFHGWIVRNEASTMKASMIASIRELAGLGCPPAKYTTNRNESMNKVAKEKCGRSRSSWVQLNNSMYDLVTDQLKEVEKAVYGMGEYIFEAQYQNLMISSSKWFMMTPGQRKQHLQKVFETHSVPFETQGEASCSTAPSTSTIRLSVQPEKLGIMQLSSDLVMSLWKKAERLLNSHN